MHTKERALIAGQQFPAEHLLRFLKRHALDPPHIRAARMPAQHAQHRGVNLVFPALALREKRLSRQVRLELAQLALHASPVLPLVDRQPHDGLHHLRHRAGPVAHAKADGVSHVAAAHKPHAQVCALLADGPHVGRVHAAHAEHRRGIAKARGLHRRKRLHERLGHVRQLELEVVFLRRNERLRLGLRKNRLRQAAFELRYVLRLNRQARRLRVAAKADKQVPAGGKRPVNIHARNRARRADAHVAVLRQQNRRPLVLFHQPRSR